jgi:MFS transporter, DHA1 family, inner membrane transport protein
MSIQKQKRSLKMNRALLALAAAAFGIGTTEFVIMGLLPDVATDLSVSIPTAGMLITGYALSVAFGAPIMALVTAKWPRRFALLVLMGIFIIGNILCAVAGNYTLLMIARVVTALCHGAFFGIGSVAAASLVPEQKKASAVAMMFMGLTLANVIGVPLGTALGQAMGWRSPFWVVAIIGVVAFAALYFLLPKDTAHEASDMKTELKALNKFQVWLALAMTAFVSASTFALFTYIAPILRDVTGVSPQGVTLTLFLLGLGLTIGNYLGGKLADWRLSTALIAVPVVIIGLQVLFYLTSLNLILAEITLFVWSGAAFAAVAVLQLNAIKAGDAAPNLISTLNIGAFNLGNAIGAATGGAVISAGLGFQAVTLSAAALALIALLIALLMVRQPIHKKSGHTTVLTSQTGE